MPMRINHSKPQNGSTSPNQSRRQSSPGGLPRRSNSISSPSVDNGFPRGGRQKRYRYGSGASLGSSDVQQPCRKPRRNRSVAGNNIRETLSAADSAADIICNGEFASEGPTKCFGDSGESDSNSRMEAIKTVVEEVTAVQVTVRVDDDGSGTQTPQSNDEGNNSENEDEQVAKLPPTSFPDTESTCDSSTTVVAVDKNVQRSLSSVSVVPRSISCDSSIPSTSSSALPVDAAFRQQVIAACSTTRLPKSSLSSFSSVTSLVDAVLEPLSMILSPGEPVLSAQHQPDNNPPSQGLFNESSSCSFLNTCEPCSIVTDQHIAVATSVTGRRGKRKREPISRGNPKKPALKTPTVEANLESDMDVDSAAESQPHVYPLRSRIRQEQLRREWEERQAAPRQLDSLPFELILRIAQYLSVQDLFSLQCLNKRLKVITTRHLRTLKRINFSSGLPFAYLPRKLNDAALKRILSYTPEVTHILGFYPRRIYDNTSPELQHITHALTYDGVFEAFRSCTKLRSVELMDVGLMSLLVNRLPNVKFHGMFRNRPDSWDSEYAVPMPPEPVPLSSPSDGPSTPSSTTNNLAHVAAAFIHRAAASGARLARWFEPVGEVPQLQGSPCCPQYTYLYPHAHRVFLQPHFHMHAQRNVNQAPVVTESPPTVASVESSNAGWEQGAHGSMMAFAIATAFVPPEGVQDRNDLNPRRRVRGGAVGSTSGGAMTHLCRPPIAALLSGVSAAAAAAAAAAAGSTRDTQTGAPVSPFSQLTRTPSVSLPLAISNLTKLDLVSVAISVLPRLDNVKYLHLKWVLFTQQDPFASFQAGKLQSFVMNNCVGPRRYLRYVRVFAVLARAPQLARLELVGTRFIEGLLEQIVDRHEPPILCFRNLQRLVLAGNRDSTAVDAGLLLLAGQQSLVHAALQLWHTKNSLFEALSYARVRLSRLESLILGYQDPYRARLTPTEAMDLDLAESTESSLPYCSFTNRGLALVFPLCPRLSSLTIRHAPYITRFPRIDQLIPVEAVTAAAAATAPSQPSTSIATPVPSQFPQSSTSTVPGLPQPPQIPTSSSGAPKIVPNTVYRSSLPLKSLTLENCPGITVSELESILAKGDPFGFLESLVLRDMFPLSRETAFMGPAYYWSQRWLLDPNTLRGAGGEERELSTGPDYRKLGLLLSIADLLSSRLVAYPPLSPVGIGMGASVRDVSHSVATTGLRVHELPVQPFDIFFTLRTHTYLTSLLQLDGTCGRRAFGLCRIHRLLLDTALIDHPPEVGMGEEEEEAKSASFISRSTQTCVCGLLEWDFVQRLHVESGPSQLPPADPKDQGLYQHQHQLGGPLAFHPFPVLLQHNALYQKLICSDWADKICATTAFDRLRDKQRSYVRPLCGSGECFGCSSGLVKSPSETQAEPSLHHTPRIWTARDACVDTSELRQFVGPKPCVLTLRQPIASPLSCLTTLHFEHVGLTHLVLSSVPRLKNITLENCPALTAILFHAVVTGAPATAITASSTVFSPRIPVKMTNPVPSLRRVRIIRCPKFAIYNWLGAVAALYPYHEENMFITFRPFGPYHEAVEQALWRNAKSVHVMISHDYSIDRSECAMEETNSAFEQRFREVISLTDSFHRRSSPADPNSLNQSLRPRLFHSDEGADWSLLTDIAWAPQGALDPTVEVSTTDPQPPSNIVDPPTLFDEGDDRSRFEAFLAAYRGEYKFHRRGIHLHVQYRDVHEGVVGGGDSGYLLWPYTDSYLQTVPPEDDLNAWGDGFNESWVHVLPPHTRTGKVLVDIGNVSMLAAMEARLGERKRRRETEGSAEAPMVAEVKISRFETEEGGNGGL
ncbi:F-box only protein 38 [Echinococcus granulosus]|uniref:F box protein 38 n=1 Tax=Echinococcus granulosus TaxID=6210 RepID=A0A068WVK7_ECHGR|nr:F-box only protein 38 [Echinococcus granulosus]CDS23824.1 F box protein 38 [Echinococcus granulosus]